jgi:HK97 family phage major capsid protein
MTEEMKTLQSDLNKAWDAMKSRLDQQDQEIKKYGDSLGETKEVIDKLEKQIQAVETKMMRPPVADTSQEDPAMEQKAIDAFNAFARKGLEKMSPELRTVIESKALATDQADEGGIIVPRNVENRLITKFQEFSPLRTLASVATISVGNSLQIPVEKDTASAWGAGWVGERQARVETATGKFEAVEIPTHEMYAEPKATQTMLDDTAFNVEQWINNKIAEKFALIEGEAFLTGDGVGKPMGILTARGIAEIKSGHATEITMDALFDMFYALKEKYEPNAQWLLRRVTMATIRKFKTGDGHYVWQPGLTDGTPATLLGKPYKFCLDMPQVAANAYPLLFGDFKQAYQIVDRQGIKMLRDPYSSKPFILFYTTKRVGGQVILPEAIVKMKISA